MYLSLVIPSFNEEKTILPFYEEAVKICELIDGEIEFIFIDDGSKDNTLQILRFLARQNDHTHYLSFSRNFGKEAAMLAGLRAARGKYTAILDADLQDPPSLIPQMLEAVVSGEYDCAGARRINRTGEPPIRSFFARCFYVLFRRLTNIEVVNGARDFRLMNRKYLDAILSLPEQNRFLKGIYPWIGFKTKWFEYENIERVAGKTKWSFWRLFQYSLDSIITFSSKPLAIASLFGILFFIISVVFVAFIVFRKMLYGDPVGGWASTVCIILFCSGIQLFTTGIVGQYVAKIFTEVKHRPHFVIKGEG